VKGFFSSLASFSADPPASLEHLLLAFISKGDLAELDADAAERLSRQLDKIQQATGCTVISVIDADDSGRFLPILKGQGRITISSTGSEGAVSRPLFCRFFFSAICHGMDIYRAFQAACLASGYYTAYPYPYPYEHAYSYDYDPAQSPLLDDNGNGLGSEYGQNYDGRTAGSVYLGSPFEPVAGESEIVLPPGVHIDVEEEGTASATVWASVSDPDSRVTALIIPPCKVTAADTVTLVYDPDTNRFEATYDGFTQQGVYRVVVYAEDRNGLIDYAETRYLVLFPDEFEPDDDPGQARAIVVNKQPAQRHSFHSSNDEDWVYFYGYAGLPYEVRVTRAWSDCLPLIEVYAPNGRLVSSSTYAAGFSAPENGFYKVRVSYTCPVLPAAEYPFYDLSVTCDKAGTGGVWGWVRDADTGEGIAGVRICSQSGECTTSLSEWRSNEPTSHVSQVEAGFFFMDTLPKVSGDLTLTAQVTGYLPTSLVISGADYDENIINKTFFLKRDPAIPYQPAAADPVNARMAAGLLYCESPGIKVEVPLSAGLNLFSYPQVSTNVWDFLVTYGQLNRAEGPCFSSIRQYNGDIGNREMCFFVPPSSQGAGGEGLLGEWSLECSRYFTLIPAEGYAVYMRRGATLHLPVSLSNPAIDLKEGRNLVGIPNPPYGYTSYRMLQDIGTATEVSSICRFDSSTGRWQIAYWDHNQPAGDNFPIRSGQGCLVHMTREKQGWLPGK
jgi:hypothetical protein